MFIMLASVLLLLLSSFGEEVNPETTESSKHSIIKKFKQVQAEIRGDAEDFKPQKQAGPIKKTSKKESSQKSMMYITFKMVFGLVFIIILAVFSLRFLKKFQNASMLKKFNKKQELIEIMETCYLGNDQKIVVIKIQNTLAILGVTSHGINLIKELNPGETIAANSVENTQQSAAFSDNLNQFLSKFKKPKTLSQTLREQ